MKTIKLLPVIIALFFALKVNSQTCVANFIYTLNPNGSVTFSNTSSVFSPTVVSTYIWDLGNGGTFTTTSLSQTVGTTYTSSGTYTVSLAVTSTICSSWFNQTIGFSIPGCPLSTSVTASGGVINPTVNFNGTATGTLSGSTYNWDFGDGNSSNALNAVHVYTANGLYGYKLTVSNNATCSAFAQVTSQQAYGGPTDLCFYPISMSYSMGGSPGVINFTLSPPLSTTGNIIWAFGNSSGATGVNTVSTTYYNGTWTPIVYVNYNGACTQTASGAAITVTNNPCYANAAFTHTIGSGGNVQFSAPATNTAIVNEWDFGDGNTSTLNNPMHSYSAAGNYTVSLFSHDAINMYTCADSNAMVLNITGVPCIANANFSLSSSPFVAHYYNLTPSYPYNISVAVLNWGDGNTTVTGSNLFAYHTYSAAGSYDICLTVTATCGSTATSCSSQYLAKGTAADMIYVNVKMPDKVTAVEENIPETILMELFPNPNTDGIMNIRLNEATTIREIEVYDLLGKRVYVNTSPGNEELSKIDVGGLTNGIYFLKLHLPQRTLTEKFIISK